MLASQFTKKSQKKTSTLNCVHASQEDLKSIKIHDHQNVLDKEVLRYDSSSVPMLAPTQSPFVFAFDLPPTMPAQEENKSTIPSILSSKQHGPKKERRKIKKKAAQDLLRRVGSSNPENECRHRVNMMQLDGNIHHYKKDDELSTSSNESVDLKYMAAFVDSVNGIMEKPSQTLLVRRGERNIEKFVSLSEKNGVGDIHSTIESEDAISTMSSSIPGLVASIQCEETLTPTVDQLSTTVPSVMDENHCIGNFDQRKKKKKKKSRSKKISKAETHDTIQGPSSMNDVNMKISLNESNSLEALLKKVEQARNNSANKQNNKVDRKSKKATIHFNSTEKGTALVNHNSIAVHREKTKCAISQGGNSSMDGPVENSSNAFSFGFDFTTILPYAN